MLNGMENNNKTPKKDCGCSAGWKEVDDEFDALEQNFPEDLFILQDIINNKNEKNMQRWTSKKKKPNEDEDHCSILNDNVPCSETFIENGVLFTDVRGYPMHFIIIVRDDKIYQKCKRIIMNAMGAVSRDVKDFSAHSVVLVEDKSKIWPHTGDVFKLSYINECIKTQQLLDITQFLRNISQEFVDGFNYMDICYKKLYTWNDVPLKYKLQVKDKKPQVFSNSDDEGNLVIDEPRRTLSKRENKCTRFPYTYNEKEKILKYIMKKKEFEKVKGRQMWMEMEEANICPLRTWQSLKEHFLKKILPALRTFKFLTTDDRHNFNMGAGRL